MGNWTQCVWLCVHTHTRVCMCVHMWCMTDLHMVLPLNVNTNTQKSTKFETIHSASNTIQTITILGSAIKSNLEAQTQKWWANTLSLIFKLFLCKKKKKKKRDNSLYWTNETNRMNGSWFWLNTSRSKVKIYIVLVIIQS